MQKLKRTKGDALDNCSEYYREAGKLMSDQED